MCVRLCLLFAPLMRALKSPFHKQDSVPENLYTSLLEFSFDNRRLVVVTRVIRREFLAPGIRKRSSSRSDTLNTTYQPVRLMDSGNAVSVNAATQR